MLNKVLEVFVKVWLCLVLVFSLLSIAGQVIGAETLWIGVNKVLASANPFQLPSMWTTIIFLLLPALGANIWLEERRGYHVH